MKHILLFALTIFAINSYAQTLSEQQVRQYLDALQKEEIISEFGKDGYLKAFDKENSAIKQRLSTMPIGALGNFPDSVFMSRGAILGFVGVYELIRNVGSAADELVRFREMSEKILGESMYFKPEIEGDPNPKNPFSFLGLEQNLKNSKTQYLQVAEKLRRIGLVDENVYQELIKWLEKDHIKLIKDFSFFIYAARQTWFYDNYGSLKAKQFKFIDSLVSNRMLTPQSAENLRKSYQPFELKSRVELLSYCTNTLLIPEEQGNFTRQEIYENIYKQITAKLIPDFTYADFSISEIKKNNPNSPSGMFGSVLDFGTSKDKKTFKLVFKANGFSYAQKADTDFWWVKTISKSLPPDINLDTVVIKSYATFLSPLTGIGTKDFQAVNDYLTDIGSARRLMVVANEMNPLLPLKDGRKALMLVDSSQAGLFKNDWQNLIDLPIFPNKSKVDFSDKYSKDKLLQIIKDFQENGILPANDTVGADKAISDFRFESRKPEYLKRSLLLSYPSLVAGVNFNLGRDARNADTFKSAIAELARVTQGRFSPQKVTDNLDVELLKPGSKDRSLLMSYKLNDKKYEYRQDIPKTEEEQEKDAEPLKDNIFNIGALSLNEYELIELINSSLEESKIDGAFYKISTGFNLFSIGEASHYIFLTHKQYEYLEANHSEVFNEPVEQKMYESYQSQIASFRTDAFAEALKRENMLTEEAFKSLDLTKTKEPSDILKASKQALLINMNELTGKNDADLFTYVIGKINEKLLPDAGFSNISVKNLNSEDDSSGISQHLVSMVINGKPYEQILYVPLPKVVKNAIDSLKSPNSQYFPGIGEHQFKIINDFLTDSGNPYRLVIVCDYRSPFLSFVLFDSTQASLVQESLPNNYVDFNLYSRDFSRDSLHNTLFELGRLGLFNPMDEEQREAFILKLRRNYTTGKSMLENLPKVVITSNIWELDNFIDLFRSMIDSLKTISRGQFNPVRLEDNFQQMLKKGEYANRTFKYGFELNGKKYTESQFVKATPKPKGKTEKSDYEYFDFDTVKFLEFVNKALTDQNSEYLFYELLNEEDEQPGPQYIFLSGSQYRWIKTKYPDIFANQEDTRLYDSDRIDDKNKN
ncbi:hypothetical protein [Emticicia sp. 21SJ11W-3]|uniref:hypothetical protein n=1 Tax=Emticicia sp. 21SJ11W-3 TaxID=2916755 RepID=UPI00209FFB93|nr:hypothetical protein [Emticicia sp. 21SJ11W-3]UTA70042.1 hypothetical protein MB380_09525 [Emticicia sp. 21SJ11W-3]